jgi:hypothetical protein
MTRMSKNPVKITLFLIVTSILFIPLTLTAQYGTAPTLTTVDGYVILSNGDTLYGQLKWRLKYVENNPVEIKFYTENGASKIFNASEIPGFGNFTKFVKEDFDTPLDFELEHYVSMPSFKKGIPVFMNRLLKGKINVFMNRSSMQSGGDEVVEISEFDGIMFSYSSDEGLRIGPSYKTSYKIIQKRVRFSSYFVVKGDSAMIKVEKSNYDAISPGLFEDCPAIIEELHKNPDLRKFKNFMLLVEVYNQICK